jgi:hypothetical protein
VLVGQGYGRVQTTLEGSQSEPREAQEEGAWKRRAVALAPIAAAVLLLAERTIAAVLAQVGHAGAALDDTYIHFQYARAIAEGHPLRFQATAPVTSGATSALWPAVLAPFWALGARDDAIVWIAWALSFAALGALAWEAGKLAEILAGRVAAVGAIAMTLAFSGLLWTAASGMEGVPFAWAIARATRRAAEWAEGDEARRSEPRSRELVGLAWIAALFRPEGALTAAFVALTLAVFPRAKTWRGRAPSLAAGVAIVVVPCVLWAATGSPRSNTAVAKLLVGNPYYTGPALLAAVQANVKLFFGTLLQGEIWSAEFLPHDGAPVAVAGLGAVAWLGIRGGRRWRAAGVLLIAATMLAPCLYLTFLWNRLRYLWPFATGWIVGLACLARVVGDLAAEVRPRWRLVTGLLCGAFAGMFAVKIEGTIDDVAQSASGIDRQQVALGRWAHDALPRDARVGLNDTGAIAYFGERATFDVVGLTSPDEARYWVAGTGSRFEHYERLASADPARLPTHFIVYPEWMAMDAVLGEPLHEATVTDSTILGGRTMRAYVADWSSLGSGERPWSSPEVVLDAVDVADLESEAAHGYQLLGARDGEDVVHEGSSPSGARVVDGGRTHRAVERFAVNLPAGVGARGIVRLAGRSGTTVSVLVRGTPVAEFTLAEADDWAEQAFDLPSVSEAARTPIELRAAGDRLTTFHYWFVAR